MKKLTIVSLLLAALVFAAGCAGGPAVARVRIQAADFQSDASGILEIRNWTGFDVAVFAGKVERGAYLGAVRARSSRYFDLKKLAGIPQKGAFLFRAAAISAVDSKGFAGLSEEDVVYTGLVAYDLGQPDRKISKSIFTGADEEQETFIYVSNVTRYVVELRIDSPDGEVAAVLSPGQRNKKLWIKPQADGLPYRFFPTYIYVNPNTGEMDAFTDEVNKSGPRFEPSTPGSDVRVITFDDPATRPGGKVYTVAFITLQNDTNGLLSFETAQGNYKKNTRGTVNTNPGQSDVYEVASDSGPAGRTYTNMGVEHDSGRMTFAPPVTLKPGYQYSLTVTTMNGNYQYAIRELGLKSEVENNRIDLWNEY
jgi:hypothetical protein